MRLREGILVGGTTWGVVSVYMAFKAIRLDETTKEESVERE